MMKELNQHFQSFFFLGHSHTYILLHCLLQFPSLFVILCSGYFTLFIFRFFISFFGSISLKHFQINIISHNSLNKISLLSCSCHILLRIFSLLFPPFHCRISMETAGLPIPGYHYIAPNHIVKAPIH